MSLNPALVTNTNWRVAAFSGGSPDSPGSVAAAHAVPWSFKVNNVVTAAGLWDGVWHDFPDDSYRANVIIVHKDHTQDQFDVLFLTPSTPTWFVAIKDNKLYRLGIKTR